MLRHLCFAFATLCFSLSLFAQTDEGLKFNDPDARSVKIKFKLVNNLMVIPITLNGVELTFLLDTGVDKTLLIALDTEDSLNLENTRKVNIRGLGEEDKFEAYQSLGNTLAIKGTKNTNQTVYFIIDKNNELAKSLGQSVNGIIGYDFFKNFIVRINYQSKSLKLYNPDKFKRKLRAFESLPLQFYRNKPYLNLEVVDETITKNSLNLLVDTGNGSSIWLFENEYIKAPELYFEDILGYGFNSIINGKRAKVNQIKFGKYKFNQPKVAYPDTEQILEVEKNIYRDGTLGSEILKRFKLFVDYSNQRLFFRANSDFNEPFNYDMSGLILEVDGVKLVKEIKRVSMNTRSTTSNFNTKSNSSNLVVSVGVKPKVNVKAIRSFSPAEELGILPGDELLKINGKNAYSLSLEEIQSILSEKEGNKVKLELMREGENYKIILFLRNRFKDLLNNPKN